MVPKAAGICRVPQSMPLPVVGKQPWVVGSLLLASWQLWMAMPICLRLLELDMRLAASRTFCTAGTSKPTSTAMMAITTSSSISVKPRRYRPERKRIINPSMGD